MKKTVFLSFFFIGSFISGKIQSQESRSIETEVWQSYVFKKGTTPALRDLKAGIDRGGDKKKYYKTNIRPPRNFIGRHGNRKNELYGSTKYPDLLRQRFFNKSSGIVVEPLVNVDGLSTGSSPHDPTGDVGKKYYMQAVNATQIGLYDKLSGDLVEQFAAGMLWSTVGFNSGGDPIVLYDQEYERWIITEFPSGFNASANQLLFAISTSDDPLGTYDVYNFATPNFPDYPKYGIWNNAYCVTTNEQGAGVLHGYYINREEMLAGQDVVNMQRVSYPGNLQTEAGFYVAAPVDWSGITPPPQERGPISLALNDSSWNTDQQNDQIEVFSLEIDWDNTDNTQWKQLSLEVTAFDANPCALSNGFSFACIPQPGGQGLDGIPETIMNQVHYRNFGSYEAIVLNFITDVTAGENVSGIRWMELRRSSTSDWQVYQEGSYAPDDGLNRFMGSIAMDGSGNIGLAYNVSSENEFAGIRFTGRRSGDPLGIMTVNEYNAVEGRSIINSGSRFGDYAHMSIDPYDDKTFWFTSEYAGDFGTQTRIISFELTRDSFDLGPLSLKNQSIAASLDTAETIEVEIRNFGILPVDSFELGYILDDSIRFSEWVYTSLASDDIYLHSFSQKANLSEIGDYSFKIYSSMAMDSAVFNDTISSSIKHIPVLDGSILEADNEPTICGSEGIFSLGLYNSGFDTINSMSLQLLVNGDTIRAYTYSGEIGYNQTVNFGVPVSKLQDGSNEIQVFILSVNGEVDSIAHNNILIQNISVINNGFIASLELTFDDYPQETTWSLRTDDGEELASGGPYDPELAQMMVLESFCLDPDSCYEFVLFDSYGDGISFGGVEGNYDIFNNEGLLLTSLLNPDFGTEEGNDFCAQFECTIELEASAMPASEAEAEDGLIMIEVINGLGPFNYSIDGGQTVQNSPVFSNLPAGRYEILVTGVNDCTEIIEVELPGCELSASIDILAENDLNTNDGSISILASGEFGSLEYSIDDGLNFTVENIFYNLTVGDYDIVVRDSLGCTFTETVRVGNLTSTVNINNLQEIKLYPNPTDGVFRIELEAPNGQIKPVTAHLFTSDGKLIQSGLITFYDDKYRGIMSLYHYPVGNYYISIDNTSSAGKLWRIIKQ